MDNIYGRMQEKADKDKAYHVDVWKSHIIQLYKLVSDNEGGMPWSRYEELKAELMGYAEASWAGNEK